jgi:hypothetical protein
MFEPITKTEKRARTTFKTLDLAKIDMNLSILRITNLNYSKDIKIKTILASLSDYSNKLNDSNFKSLTLDVIYKIGKIL